MNGSNDKALGYRLTATGMAGAALLLCACSLATGTGTAGSPRPSPDREVADLTRIPQQFSGLVKAAGDRPAIAAACRGQLLEEFYRRFYAPWNSPVPVLDPAEVVTFMKKEARAGGYGVNERRVAPKQLQELLDNCALASFPTRNEAAIAVAPGHLRGLPTGLPLYEHPDSGPFDTLSYPQVKLNEPLKVLHASRDGVWLFVETGYSNGWIEARDVALVDRAFIDAWKWGPHLVIVRDFASVKDGTGGGAFRSKIGTILPLSRVVAGEWEVRVASSGEGGKAEVRTSRLPLAAAAPFPLAFDRENIALIGDQLLGQPYGWGESYDLRDCSALLRDFFLSFGIWMPRTSGDQIVSLGPRTELARLSPARKAELIREHGIPFLTLIHKPGHIMLYVGEDAGGRPLVFQDAWSIRVRDGGGDRQQIIGLSAITTLEPGRELGLVPGSSLLERATDLATVTGRCTPK